ncbi:MAG: tyrosine-type recombinase/integrase [Pseudonocardiales bacterium]|nr:tyrosine-type recombinase/integrase [Pseudonocardiales bacterium]
MTTTYDVRVWKTGEVRGARGTSYRVRWVVAGTPYKKPFRTSALAESFRSVIVTEQRKGEAFLIETGLPVSIARAENEASWFEFSCRYIDSKWHSLAGNSRRTTAQALTTAMLALLSTERGKPETPELRRTLVSWAFNTRARAGTSLPDETIRPALDWLSHSTRPVGDLSDAGVTRRLLDSLTTTHDGQRASAATVQRRRGVIVNALHYAVEWGLLPHNPVASLSWKAPRTSRALDKRVVVNPIQARRLLAAVHEHGGPSGSSLVAFFGVMYYSALRPGEALNLRKSNLLIPAEGWGELIFEESCPSVGSAWSDGGTRRETRQLKHRAKGETRSSPCPPELTHLLRQHLTRHGTDAEGRLFRGIRGGRPLEESTYHRVWRKARENALSAAEFNSPLARRPYDLRHAAVSTWLNAGVPATQVAEWAEHSVAVLLQIYAKCLAGQEEVTRTRIDVTLREA